MSFVHLHVHSPYSFLDGASDLETLVRRAAEFGMPALALTDHNSLAGAVRFAQLCDGYGVRPIHGAEVSLEDGSHLTLLAANRAGYANLCALLTLAYAHGGRLTPLLPRATLAEHASGLFCLTGCRNGQVHALTRAHRYAEAEAEARLLRDWFGPDRLWIELSDDFTPDCMRVCRQLAELATHLGVGAVVTNNVHYAARRDFIAHDVLRCIGAGLTLGDIHPARPLNFERWLKPAAKLEPLFAWCPEALANSIRIAERCERALPAPEQITPRHPTPDGRAAADYLRHLAYKGARARYKQLTPEIEARLEHELAVISELGYADYLLLAWKVARWARQQGIRCTGRGSAADSCVAYALLLTDVDVIGRNLPFARFLAPGKAPDVDLDFDSTRRDEVFAFIKREWGERNVAMACTFHTYHAKSALRDVGKVLGLPAETLRFFSHNIAHFVRADQVEAAFGRNPELKPHAHLVERFKLLFDLCGRIAGFPRHIGTHSSGVVIGAMPLDTIAPMQPTARGVMPIVQLDKDDAEAIGAIKLDVLSLRILAAVQDAEADIRRSGAPDFRYDRIPQDDADTYRLIQSGHAMGAFQLESPAQMALAAALSPTHFEDLVASVALIRPGPIRSNAVKRFVACRNGWARIDVLHPCLAPILAKTYGCVVFQEQVVQVIAAMIGCSDAAADALRKRLAKHDKLGTLETARDEFIAGARRRHPDLHPERAMLIWQQIESWSGYGFTEGHAASFAITAQRSAYLSQHHPAEYFAALMSNQPMGYYSANSLAAEARRRGVQILPVDINRSEDKCHAGEPDAIRLGLRLVEGLRAADIAAILHARGVRPFASLLDFCARVSLHRDSIENLVLCGAFDSLHERRRGLLWRLEETLALAHTCRQQGAGAQTTLALGDAATLATPLAADIPEFSPWDAFLWEWRVTGVATGCHPLAYLRERLDRSRILTARAAQDQPAGLRVTVAGLNLRPHRPPTRSGRRVLFTTIEDESDFLQAVCIGDALEAYPPVFLLSPAVIVRGRIEHRGTGTSLLVEKAMPLRMADFISSDISQNRGVTIPACRS